VKISYFQIFQLLRDEENIKFAPHMTIRKSKNILIEGSIAKLF